MLGYALSGWGTGWYLNYQSAALVGLPTSSGTSPISNFLGYGPGPAQLIPGMSPWSVDWTDYSGTHHTDPLNINCHCFDPTKTQVLNPAALTNVPNGQFAANQSSIRSFRGFALPCGERQLQPHLPHQRTLHSANSRGVHEYLQPHAIRDSARPDLAINLGNFATAPTTFTSGPNKGLYSGGFGTIVPETRAPSVSAPARWSPAFRSSPASHSGAREIDLRAL